MTRYFKYVALVAVLMVPVAYSQAQVSVGVGVGPVGVVVGHPYVAGPPVCAYGYYSYYPYACAPYGYYGPRWFVNGVFIGAGPWYHGYWHRDWDGDHWRHEAWEHGYGRGYGYGRQGYRGYIHQGYGERGYARAYNGGGVRHEFRGEAHGGGWRR